MSDQLPDRPERGDRMDVLAHCDRWTLVAVEPESGLGGGQRAIVNGPPVPLGGGFEVVAIDDLRGAVDALVDIWRANHNDAARWPAYRAAEALGRLGIDPATYRGRYAAPASDEKEATDGA